MSLKTFLLFILVLPGALRAGTLATTQELAAATNALARAYASAAPGFEERSGDVMISYSSRPVNLDMDDYGDLRATTNNWPDAAPVFYRIGNPWGHIHADKIFAFTDGETGFPTNRYFQVLFWRVYSKIYVKILTRE